MADKERLKSWQKFPLDRDAMTSLRAMLDLQDDDELPENLWKVLALHKAMECRFTQQAWGFRDLVKIVLDAERFGATFTRETKFIAGAPVFVTKHQREGTYWFPAPFGRHIVNCHGDVYLVKTDEIVADDSAVSDSDLNRHARLGAKLEAAAVPQAKKTEPAHAV